MTTFFEARQYFEDSLRRGGFRGRGATWRLQGDGVAWVVHVERPPKGNRIAIEIGLNLWAEPEYLRANDCPMILYPEVMPLLDVYSFRMASDLESGMESDARHQALVGAGDKLVAYLKDHLTREAVLASYRAGEFRSAFIRKDAREYLDAGVVS